MSRGRRIALGLGVLLLAALAFGTVRFYLPTREAVAIGAATLAKQMCSCIFVAERSAEACRADQLEALDPVQFEVTREPAGVRAFVPAFGERTARFREGLGCTLE